MKAILVTACDAGFFDLFRGLILSIREKPQGCDMPLGCIDIGLGPSQRDWAGRQGVTVEDGRWDVSAPIDTGKLPQTLQALTCRPYLPAYFPGFDVYLWIDADTWVQEWRCIAWYLQAAAGGALAITPEVDRSYNSLFEDALGHLTKRREIWTKAFGAEVAEKYHRSPPLNAGVFALSAANPIWERFRTYLDVALGNGVTTFADQVALCRTAWEFGTNAPLPAICNWMCLFAEPRFDPKRGVFTEPAPPYATLGILHLAGAWKRREYVKKGLLYRRGAYLNERPA